jgi:hypothetical protein
MTAPIRINPALLSLDELVQLADALRVKPGERSLATRAAIATRDELIRELGRRFYPGQSRNQQAEAIHRELQRYAGSSWLRTRADLECRHRDARRPLVWKILKVRGGNVPSVRLLNDILASRTS